MATRKRELRQGWRLPETRKIGNNPHPNTPARNASRSDAGGPSLRLAGFEDEDDDEDEDEATCEIARTSEGRYRKQPKIDALRQYKEEILEAYRYAASAAVRGD